MNQTDRFGTEWGIVANMIKTPDGTILQSKNRHDYVTHVDKVTGETYMVDGGISYLRRSLNKVPALELSVYEDACHEIKRRYFVWGSNDGKWRSLETMSNAHIEAILETQYQIRGTHVYRLFMDELIYRNTKAIFVEEYK